MRFRLRRLLPWGLGLLLLSLALYVSLRTYSARPSMASVTISDNRDYMAVITANPPDVLAAQEGAGAFKKVHRLSDGVWLVRMRQDADSALVAALKASGAEYKIVLTRYTSGSAYRSSSEADKVAGSKLTGLRVTP
jgi:hypothetical protein